MSLPNPPSIIEAKNLKFIIFDAPNDENVDSYIAEMKKLNVLHLVRACDATYSIEKMKKNNITVHEMCFPDGAFPPKSIIEQFLRLCKDHCKPDQPIGVHCVAGLGRAPVLVAIALIHAGMDYDQVVDLIRQKRRGAINAKQLRELKKYKPKDGCAIM